MGAPLRAQGYGAAGIRPLLPLSDGYRRPLPWHFRAPRLPRLAPLRYLEFRLCYSFCSITCD